MLHPLRHDQALDASPWCGNRATFEDLVKEGIGLKTVSFATQHHADGKYFPFEVHHVHIPMESDAPYPALIIAVLVAVGQENVGKRRLDCWGGDSKHPLFWVLNYFEIDFKG